MTSYNGLVLCAEEQELLARYQLDPSSPYSMTRVELGILLAVVGEDEPIIDAIMKLDGASVHARAEAIGCQPSDFDNEKDYAIDGPEAEAEDRQHDWDRLE